MIQFKIFFLPNLQDKSYQYFLIGIKKGFNHQSISRCKQQIRKHSNLNHKVTYPDLFKLAAV